MRFLILSFLVLLPSKGFSADLKYQIYANKTTPYGLRFAELGKSEGLVIELLEGALKNAGLEVAKPPPDEPWARAQTEGKEIENSLIIPFARTPAREPNFKWVAVLLDEKLLAFVKRGKTPPSSFDELRKFPVIGVASGSAPESRMKEMGIKHQSFESESESFKKLVSGQIDVILSQGYIGNYEIKSLGAEGQSIIRSEPILDLPLWVATSVKTSRPALEKAREAVEKFKKTAEYQAILKKY